MAFLFPQAPHSEEPLMDPSLVSIWCPGCLLLLLFLDLVSGDPGETLSPGFRVQARGSMGRFTFLAASGLNVKACLRYWGKATEMLEDATEMGVF